MLCRHDLLLSIKQLLTKSICLCEFACLIIVRQTQHILKIKQQHFNSINAYLRKCFTLTSSDLNCRCVESRRQLIILTLCIEGCMHNPNSDVELPSQFLSYSFICLVKTLLFISRAMSFFYFYIICKMNDPVYINDSNSVESYNHNSRLLTVYCTIVKRFLHSCTTTEFAL